MGIPKKASSIVFAHGQVKNVSLEITKKSATQTYEDSKCREAIGKETHRFLTVMGGEISRNSFLPGN